MFKFFKRNEEHNRLDKKVLRRNNISLLILDERWNGLFNNVDKTPEIIVCEEALKELLKEQSRLISESKENQYQKKVLMDKIIQLTTEAFENNNEEARSGMQHCEKEIKRINERAQEIQAALDAIPERINERNLELLEYIINVVYYKIRANQKRVKELETLIEETKEKLKAFIDEKELLSQDDSTIYTYFHDLLGAEELEKLDKEFFGNKE